MDLTAHATTAKSGQRFAQLDGLRGLLCVGVIAINMDLYNAGANTPVGVFLVLSGFTAFIAYNDREWDDRSRTDFFLCRLVRLLPMMVVSTSCQLCAAALWLFRRGVVIPWTECANGFSTMCSTGGFFNFGVTLLALLCMLAGGGVLCRGTVCGCWGCCRLDRWPRPTCCALLPLVCGTYLTGTGWYVGVLLILNAHFLPKLLTEHGEGWRSTPPSWMNLLFWASLEALQFAWPYVAFQIARSVHPLGVAQDIWYVWTLYIYLGFPPLYRVVTFVFGMQLGRWALFESAKPRPAESRWLDESKTGLPVLVTALVVASLHGFLQHESEMHRPSTGATPIQWLAIHLIHPFNVLALVCGLVAAPRSLVARVLASPPLVMLGDLSYAMYLLQVAVITAYTFAFDKKWGGEFETLQASPTADVLDATDYALVVVLCAALAYPVTRWVEPRVAAWLEGRVRLTSQPPFESL